MINEKTQKLINEMKEILSNHYVNKNEIVRGFDRYFDLIGLSRRRVEFYEGRRGWDAVLDAARNAALDVARNAVWDATWSAARSAGWDAVCDTAWIDARNAAWDAVQDAFWNAVWDTAWNAVWDTAWNAVWSAAWDTAWNAAWNAVCLNSCDKDDNCPICEFRKKFCEPEFELFRNGVFVFWVLKDRVIVITRPIIRQVNGRLHSISGPAVEWSDESEKYYFLWGVRFDKKLWQEIVNKKISFKEIMSLDNIEQRMVALKMMDAEKLLEESGAKLLDKSERGNELYLVENIFRQPAYFLKYRCPSTGRIYISGIDPEIAKQNPKADFCMSWKMGITLEDYLRNLEVET